MIAVYTRVSTNKQDTASQKPDLRKWLAFYATDEPIEWFDETASGKTMNRPQWKKIRGLIDNKEVSTVVIWRLDRLGRTAAGLTALFDELKRKKIRLVCLSPAIDLATSGGTLIANIIASVAQWELEIISDRIKAGIAVAHAKGKRWGGTKLGVVKCLSKRQLGELVKMKAKGFSDTYIANRYKVNQSTIWRIVDKIKNGVIKL